MKAVSAAVIQDAKAVYHDVMGFVDLITKQEIDERTVFRGASLSKPVFASLVMKLADEGILDLDKPLVQYLNRPLPEFPDYRDLKEDGRYRLLTAYLHEYRTVAETRAHLAAYFRFSNEERPHQALGYRTPREVYFGSSDAPAKAVA